MTTEVRRAGRATPMTPDARREAIVVATVPLLIEHGRAVTTRQIAQAAGIAEGTIFRVFASKDELVDEAILRAFRPGPLLAGLQAVDRDQPLRERLVDMVTVMQARFTEVFGLMRAVGLVAPPQVDSDEPGNWRDRARDTMLEIVGDAPLRVTPEELVHLIRLLTFSGSHAEMADGWLLTPEQIVDVVLTGTLVTSERETPC